MKKINPQRSGIIYEPRRQFSQRLLCCQPWWAPLTPACLRAVMGLWFVAGLSTKPEDGGGAPESSDFWEKPARPVQEDPCGPPGTGNSAPRGGPSLMGSPALVEGAEGRQFPAPKLKI